MKNPIDSPMSAAIDPAMLERVLLHGDLRQLNPTQKMSYYKAVCDSVGLNPLTQPFQYLVLNGKEILYARREATEQLRMLHHISIQITAREVMEDCYVVTARATNSHGRTDENIGAVPITGLKGESRANAMMKAETKAKRRVTLAICGLGMLDETEVASIPGVRVEREPVSIAGFVEDLPAPSRTAPMVAQSSDAPAGNPLDRRVEETVASDPAFAYAQSTIAKLKAEADRLEKQTPRPPILTTELPPPAVISEPQIRRLFAISRQAGWPSQEALKAFLSSRGIEHTKDITKAQYTALCQQIERGPEVLKDEMPAAGEIFGIGRDEAF